METEGLQQFRGNPPSAPTIWLKPLDLYMTALSLRISRLKLTTAFTAFSRRVLVMLAVVTSLTLMTGTDATASTKSASTKDAGKRPIVLVFGDSLAAAYGLRPEEGWVALMQQRIDDKKLNYRIVNASISGETTSGGLTRLPAALKQHKPALVVLELGANDGLRGLSTKQAKENLDKMVAASIAAGAKVLIVGMYMPPNFGPDYTAAFAKMFSDTAEKYKTPLVPLLFEGFGERMDLFQADRLHPNKAAQPIMLNTVWAKLEPMLRGELAKK
jgi:acyl-CoA thioesterase I